MEEMLTMTECSLSLGRAATLVQGLVREINARQRMVDVAHRVIEPVYDKEYGHWSDIKKLMAKERMNKSTKILFLIILDWSHKGVVHAK
eukprot:5136334-Ditylum_brightwellii.AAC.1